MVFLHRSLNQSQDDFQIFTNNLELILDKIFEANPFLVIALEDFNTKLSQWYKNDKTTIEGSKSESLTSQYGLKKITHHLLTYLTTRLLILVCFSHRNLI